jgi:hypothetical protein
MHWTSKTKEHLIWPGGMNEPPFQPHAIPAESQGQTPEISPVAGGVPDMTSITASAFGGVLKGKRQHPHCSGRGLHLHGQQGSQKPILQTLFGQSLIFPL